MSPIPALARVTMATCSAGLPAIAGFGWRLIKPFLISPEKGAATSLFLATVADPVPFHGAYVVGRRIAEPDSAAHNDQLSEQLWAESARLVGF